MMSPVSAQPDDAPLAAAPAARPVGPVILEAAGLSKSFRLGPSLLTILRDAQLVVRRGEFVAIEGRSGSGKSTLLHLLGLLDEPEAGEIILEGRAVSKLSAAERCAIRNRDVGFVFQAYHLLPELDVMGNTMLAAMIEHSAFGFARHRRMLRDRAVATLDRMGLGDRLHHRPSQLSGGERQRVAIARALMNEPKLLLADEPTGNLDYETGQQIMDVLNSLHANGQTVIMVTHDRALARQADRVLVLRNGQLEAEPN